MSKKSLLLGILCSSLLVSYHVKAETDVSTTVNTTTTEVVTQGVNNVKVENPVITVTSTMDIPSGDIPSGLYKAVEPTEVNTVNFVEKKPVGTLVRLGVSDKSKPVGTLKYYTQQLPNTNSENKKIGVLSGVVLLMGLLVHGLYYFSKRIFS